MTLSNQLIICRDGANIKQSPAEPFAFERYGNLLVLSSIITWMLWFSYELVQFNIAYQIPGDDSHSTFRIWLVLACELFLSFPEMILAMNLIFTLLSSSGHRPRPRYELTDGQAPSIDVFITCCGEPVDVILDTIRGATQQNYPKTRFRIFVLDDGHDEYLRKQIERLSKDKKASTSPALTYFSRKIGTGERSYFKAGNIQFGIEQSAARSGSEYIASLDADMIPEPDWLRKVIPHLILDDKIALVAPPQDYYNTPLDDPFGNKAEFDLWFSLYEPLNDRLDSAMCTGTGYIVRRQALNEIGGWPQVEAGEDYMCSTKLSDNGWKIAFIPEKLQVGLAPDSLRAHIKQRMRWVTSGTAVHKSFGFYLPGSKLTSKLDPLQRIVGILTALREFSAITTVLSLLVLPLALFPDRNDQFRKLQNNANTSVLYHMFAAYFITQKINNYLLFGHVGIRRVWNYHSNEIWCSPYAAYRCLICLMPASLTSTTFDVSGTTRSKINERSSTSRATLLRRLFNPSTLVCLIYCHYGFTPLLLRLNNFFILESKSPSTVFFAFPGVIIKLLDCIAKASVPVWYMMFPPTTPSRKALLAKKAQQGKEDDGQLRNLGSLWALDLMSCLVLWHGLR